jgi:hypothetical protein
MMAYKFLAKGAVGPFSGFVWQLPAGDGPASWVEVEGTLGLCTRGVHVCRTVDLAHWLHDELWELETDGDQIEGVDCIVVQRARLLRRVHTWSEGGASRFADACIQHATAQAGANPGHIVGGFLEDAARAARDGYVAIAAFSAALAVAKVSGGAASERSYRNEREWQASWIAHELIGGM